MPTRIATFNVENLFSRPKAMNLANQDAGTTKLKLIAELQDEMDEETYNKPRIVELANAAHGYFTINKTRGENPLSYSRERETYRVNVDGRREWDGFIELTRDGFSFETIQNTGALGRALKADVLGLCEVEDRWALRRFRDDQLKPLKLHYDLLIDGNDPRRIDVAILSRLPIGRIRTNAHYKEKARDRWPLFSRDCLEIELLLKDRPLWVLQNHLKSKLGPPEESDARRKAQAKRIREILSERYDLKTDYVVVCGDFNDVPESDPLSPLLSLPDLKDVLDIASATHAEDRWTYFYAKKKQTTQIDYILVSRPLWDRVSRSGIDQRGIAGVAEITDGRVTPLPGITNWRNAASDHGAVWADLEV